MLKIDTWAELHAARQLPLHPAVQQALTAIENRLADFKDLPLSELCVVLVLEPPDRLDAAFDPATAEYITETGGWFELTFIISDDGFGYIVLLEDRPDGDQAVLKLCRDHHND